MINKHFSKAYAAGDRMRITGFESEQEILTELGVRIRQYRIALNITQAELADKCGISSSTEVRIESGLDSRFSNYLKILNGLGLMRNADMLVPEPQPDGETLFEQRPARKRARSNNPMPRSGWIWEDDK